MQRSSDDRLSRMIAAGLRSGFVVAASLVLLGCPYLLSNAFLTEEQATDSVDVLPVPSPVDPDRLVWVANRADGTVSVIEDPFDRITDTIAVGSDLQVIEVSPDGTRVLVASPANRRIYVLDAVDRVASGELDFAGRPLDMEYSPDGSRLYVAVGSPLGAGLPGSVVVFDASTLAQEGSAITVGNEPESLTFGGDSHHADYLYVANSGSDTVTIVDPSSRTVLDTIAPPSGAVTRVLGAYKSSEWYGPEIVVVAKDPMQRWLDVIAVRTGGFAGVIPISPTSAHTMVFNPMWETVYVAGLGDVVSIHINTWHTDHSFLAPDQALGSALSADGTVLYVTDSLANSVHRAEVDTGGSGSIGSSRSIAVGNAPWGVGVTPYWP